MAQITIPTPRSTASWLDRPIAPTWQRLAALSINWELVAYGVFIVAGLMLRLWGLGDRSVHHDESLHAYYSWKLFAGQGYTYDPLMHGPLQFEVVPLFYLLFGVGDFSARLFAVLLGTVLIALPYFLRSYLTRTGALAAALLLTISPAFVYFSRFIRDDIYLACFSLALFICLVRYLEGHRAMYLYIGAAMAALAMASMEAAYITFFIFGSFLIAEVARESMVSRDGPVLAAWRATSLDVWLTSASIFVAITVVLYSTFFTNPYGIWDTQHSLCLANCFSLHPSLDPNRKDILGGLTYWFTQQGVQRGGQPWFYYLLILPLYEQLALLFGVAGIVYGVMRRTLVTTFLVWWAVMAYAVYSWAGEKMPWLTIHIALPLILLAGLFLGRVASARWSRWTAAIAVIFAVLLAVEIHSTFVLNFVDGANPTEMLIYVQSSNDVKHVVSDINTLAPRNGGKAMPMGLDSNDVGGWPFIWYLRNYTSVTETTSFSGPVCGGQYCPVLIMLEPEFDPNSSQLLQHYVAQKYRWNWWFPEDYKTWFPAHWYAAFHGQGGFLSDLLGSPSDWSHVWNWLVYRQPFGDRGARWLYFLVRRDLVPGQRYYATHLPNTGPAPAPAPPPPISTSSLRIRLVGVLGSASTPLAGPRGIASGPDGSTYVADTLDHRVLHFGPSGQLVAQWGQAGTNTGQFNANASPEGVAVGPDNLIYVADTWNQRIQVFKPNGQYVRSWGGGPIASGPSQFYGPRSIAVSRSGRVYVADTGNRRIQVFTSKGQYLMSFGTSGSGPGQMQEPSAVAIGPDGTVYVADFWNQRIQAFTANGTYLRSWPVPDWVAKSYDEPYLAVDRSGNVFATDPQHQQVLEYSATGQLKGSFGSGQFTLPIGVAIRPNGTVAVSDATANKVNVFALLQPTTAPHVIQSVGRVTTAGKKP